MGRAWEAPGKTGITQSSSPPSRVWGQKEGRTEAASDLPPQKDLDYQKLSVKPAKERLWRLERGTDPFPHLKRKFVMIQKLLSCYLPTKGLPLRLRLPALHSNFVDSSYNMWVMEGKFSLLSNVLTRQFQKL